MASNEMERLIKMSQLSLIVAPSGFLPGLTVEADSKVEARLEEPKANDRIPFRRVLRKVEKEKTFSSDRRQKMEEGKPTEGMGKSMDDAELAHASETMSNKKREKELGSHGVVKDEENNNLFDSIDHSVKKAINFTSINISDIVVRNVHGEEEGLEALNEDDQVRMVSLSALRVNIHEEERSIEGRVYQDEVRNLLQEVEGNLSASVPTDRVIEQQLGRKRDVHQVLGKLEYPEDNGVALAPDSAKAGSSYAMLSGSSIEQHMPENLNRSRDQEGVKPFSATDNRSRQIDPAPSQARAEGKSRQQASLSATILSATDSGVKHERKPPNAGQLLYREGGMARLEGEPDFQGTPEVSLEAKPPENMGNDTAAKGRMGSVSAGHDDLLSQSKIGNNLSSEVLGIPKAGRQGSLNETTESGVSGVSSLMSSFRGELREEAERDSTRSDRFSSAITSEKILGGTSEGLLSKREDRPDSLTLRMGSVPRGWGDTPFSGHFSLASPSKVLNADALKIEEIEGKKTEFAFAKVSLNGGTHLSDERAILRQVAHHLRSWRPEDGTPIRLQLTPRRLGSLEIEMSLHERGVSAHILTGDLFVKELLEGNQTLLRDGLASQGLKMEQFSVDLGGWGRSFDQRGGESSFHKGFSRSHQLSDQVVSEDRFHARKAGVGRVNVYV